MDKMANFMLRVYYHNKQIQKRKEGKRVRGGRGKDRQNLMVLWKLWGK